MWLSSGLISSGPSKLLLAVSRLVIHTYSYFTVYAGPSLTVLEGWTLRSFPPSQASHPHPPPPNQVQSVLSLPILGRLLLPFG